MVIMILRINDKIIVGPSNLVLKLKSNLMEQFKCNNCGVLTEYIGNKFECISETEIQLVQTDLTELWGWVWAQEQMLQHTSTAWNSTGASSQRQRSS